MSERNKILILKLQNLFAKYTTQKKINYDDCSKSNFKISLSNIEKCLDIWIKENRLNTFKYKNQFEIAFSLINEEVVEDKISGVIYIQKYLIDKLDFPYILSNFSTLLEKSDNFNCSICDFISANLLSQLIENSGYDCAREILNWIESENIWKKRASIISFINLVNIYSYESLIMKNCEILIKNRSRYLKLAVGKVLSEISRKKRKKVTNFVKNYLKYFSIESIKLALKYFDSSEFQTIKKEFVDLKIHINPI